MSVSLNSSLYMGANALQAQSVGVQTAGNDISNANTPGATREVVGLEEVAPVQVSAKLTEGLGSVVSQVESIRSSYLDNAVQQQTSSSNFASTMEQEYNLIQAAFGEDITSSQVNSTSSTSGTGIAGPLNSFFSAVQQLSTDPTNSVYRDNVSSSLNTLVNQITSSYNQILTTKKDSFAEASDAASTINQLSSQIAQLNGQIAEAEGESLTTNPNDGLQQQANALRDQRQELIQKLSQYVSIKVDPNQGTLSDMTNIELADPNGNSMNPPVYLVNEQYGAGANDTGNPATATYPTVRLDVVAVNPGTTTASDAGGAYDQTENSDMMVVASSSSTAGFTPPSSPNLTTITAGSNVTGAASPLDSNGLTYVTNFNNSTTAKTLSGGQLGAYLEQANNVIGSGQTAAVGGTITQQFNNFVSQLVSEINTVQSQGYDNETPQVLGGDGAILAITGTNSSTLTLNNAYNINNSAYNRNYFAASGASGGASLGVLDGSNAAAMANLSQTSLTTGKTALPETYQEVISQVGQNTSEATQNSAQASLLLQQTTNQQQSVEGINMDEELTNLTVYQNAYNADAKFISVVADMLNNLIENTIVTA